MGFKGYGQTFTSIKFELLGRTPYLISADSEEETYSHFEKGGSNYGGRNFEKPEGNLGIRFKDTIKDYDLIDKNLSLSEGPIYNQNRPVDSIANFNLSKNDS